MSATIKNKAECQQLYGTNSILSLFAPSLKSPLGYNSSKIWISHCFFQLKWLFIESMKVVTLPLLKNYFVEFNIVTFLLSTTFCEVDNLCPRFESFGDISMKIMREFFLEFFFSWKILNNHHDMNIDTLPVWLSWKETTINRKNSKLNHRWSNSKIKNSNEMLFMSEKKTITPNVFKCVCFDECWNR